MHGIPISIKDSIQEKGKLATVGCALLCSQRAESSAAIVEMYVKAGAIPLVRGNCSQASLSMHTENYIWGEAKNPLNQARSCGGSSGGDTGLVAAECVPFAIADDFGGSLRVPASFCGVYCFKPTQARSPLKGIVPARLNQYNLFNKVRPVAGPIGGSVDDLILGMKVQCDEQINVYDPTCLPCPWNESKFLDIMQASDRQSIKIGILQESDHLQVSESVKRAL